MLQLLFLVWLFPATATSPQAEGSIQLTLKNIESEAGNIHLAVYNNQQDFEQQGTVVYGTILEQFSTEEATLQLPKLSYGTYAIAVFHDQNNNGKLDKNLMGIPKEPYAFSNNPKVKWEPPTFEKSRFQLEQANLRLQIELKEWNAY